MTVLMPEIWNRQSNDGSEEVAVGGKAVMVCPTGTRKSKRFTERIESALLEMKDDDGGETGLSFMPKFSMGFAYKIFRN